MPFELAALAALPASCATVLVHDGARPLVSRATIDAVIATAATGAGAVAAVPLGDTLKEVEEGASPLVVELTIPRQRLWRAQTPQGFPRALLERALQAAAADAVQGTDDAELVERIGGRVEVVPDQPANIKLTTPGDFALAEALLRPVEAQVGLAQLQPGLAVARVELNGVAELDRCLVELALGEVRF